MLCPERDLLIRVRTGRYPIARILAMAEKLTAEREQAAKGSPLPERVDRLEVSWLLAHSYQKVWAAELGV